MKMRWILQAVLLIGAIAHGASAPVISQSWILKAIPLKVDAQLGKATVLQVERNSRPVRNPAVQSYIREIGRRLVAQIPNKPFPYTFKVIHNRSVNAFAIPGGYIYVHTGLIQSASDEDELAGVLAHEVAHIALRHSTRNWASLLGVNTFMWLASVLASAYWQQVNFETWSRASHMATSLIYTKFSRDSEREADRLAITLVTRAGYRPDGLLRFFAKLPKMRSPAFLSTHPPHQERIERVNREIRHLNWIPEPSRPSDRLRQVQRLL